MPEPQMPSGGCSSKVLQEIGPGSDLYIVDDALVRPLADPGDALLQRRAGRARAHEHPVLGADHDLGIRSHVDQDRRLLGTVNAGGKDARHDVAAHVAAGVGKHIDQRFGIEVKAELGRGKKPGVRTTGTKGSTGMVLMSRPRKK